MWFSPSIRHVSRSKIHIYSCSQHILMTTITPTTSIKSSISFYSKSIKVFQHTDLRIYSNFTFYPLGKEIGNDVNVTSIYSNTRTHILIFLYKTNLCFDLQLWKGGDGGIDVVFSLHTTRKSVKNPHLFLLLTHSNDYYNTYHQYKKQYQFLQQI